MTSKTDAAKGAADDMTIWALFAQAQDAYDQQEHDLLAWWPDKPSVLDVATAIGVQFPCINDTHTLAVVNVWARGCVGLPSGGESRRIGKIIYTLTRLSPGVV